MDIIVLVIIAVVFVGIVLFMGARAKNDFSGEAVFTKNSKISDILAVDDDIAKVLEAQGLNCMGCPSAAGETLDQACTVHNLSTERILLAINAYVKDKDYVIKTYTDGCPDEAMQVRQTVFVDEQHFEDEFDEIDDIATHYVLFDKDKPIGCARSYYDKENKAYRIGRMAVIKPYRHMRLGQKIMAYVEEDLKKKGAKKILLSSQMRAKGFYQSIGYTPYGEKYYDQHCPHIAMEKTL
ncbi:MAG: GNAT family N-acetyltransferase [Eubacterium sp.]|nr:GNAT family N-acetyltransferase [Eubacterium sp.]